MGIDFQIVDSKFKLAIPYLVPTFEMEQKKQNVELYESRARAICFELKRNRNKTPFGP